MTVVRLAVVVTLIAVTGCTSLTEPTALLAQEPPVHSPGYVPACATRDDEVAEWFFTHFDEWGVAIIFRLVADGRLVYIEKTPWDARPFRWQPNPNDWCAR